MAEDQQEAPAPRGLKKVLITIAAALVLAAVAGGAVFFFVVLPRLQDDAPVQDTQPVDRDVIPGSAVTVNLDTAYTTVTMSDPQLPASTLIYRVSLLCANPETAAAVENNKALFEDMLRDLHSHHTREQLNDPTVEQGIRRRALQRANALLGRLANPTGATFEILDVLLPTFYVDDKI